MQVALRDLQAGASARGILSTPSIESSASEPRLPVDFAKHSHLGWSHYRRLLYVADERQRAFYFERAAKERWSVRELDRQIESALFSAWRSRATLASSPPSSGKMNQRNWCATRTFSKTLTCSISSDSKARIRRKTWRRRSFGTSRLSRRTRHRLLFHRAAVPDADRRHRPRVRPAFLPERGRMKKGVVVRKAGPSSRVGWASRPNLFPARPKMRDARCGMPASDVRHAQRRLASCPDPIRA